MIRHFEVETRIPKQSLLSEHWVTTWAGDEAYCLKMLAYMQCNMPEETVRLIEVFK